MCRAPKEQPLETFSRAYVETLRKENKSLRHQLTAERNAREAAEKERDALAAKSKPISIGDGFTGLVKHLGTLND